MSSINTNNGAMIALQTLKATNKNLSQTQNAIATGKDISSAKDNASIWAISKVMESDVSGFKAVSDSLALGESTVAVALAGAEQITDILTQIKEKIVTGTGENVDHTKLNNDITELKGQITSIIGASQFNGANLLQSGAALSVLSSIDRDSTGAVSASNITVSAMDFTTTLTLSAISTFTTGSAAEALIDNIEASIQTAVDGAAALGAAANRISGQRDFVGKVMDAMKSGIGSLVDADMEATSARLQALQTQQQLGVQALAIANQAPQTILQLFR
jgi:flagellin